MKTYVSKLNNSACDAVPRIKKRKKIYLKNIFWEFPGNSVVWTLHFTAGCEGGVGTDSIPGWETKILQWGGDGFDPWLGN